MFLIADSGSTKTDWRLVGSQIVQAQTEGFNPYFIGSDYLAKSIETNLLPKLEEAPTAIYFYGTGCADSQKAQLIADGLEQVFGKISIEVHTDLVGAARALCLHQEGIACILGTGSNSCFYDGQKIVYTRPNLGYILGDEGSGTDLGKRLLQDYLHQNMPVDLYATFQKRYQNPTRNQLIDRIYSQPFANRYMAGYAKFLFDHLDTAYCANLVSNSFRDFFEKYILRYSDPKKYLIHFTGSVAFYFSGILREIAKEYGLSVKHILETPIAGLTLYHQKIEN